MTSLVRLIIGDSNYPATVETLSVAPQPTPDVDISPRELDERITAVFGSEDEPAAEQEAAATSVPRD